MRCYYLYCEILAKKSIAFVHQHTAVNGGSQAYLVLYLTGRGLLPSDHRLRGDGHCRGGGVRVLLRRRRGGAARVDRVVLLVRARLRYVVHDADLGLSVGPSLCLRAESRDSGQNGEN